MYRRKKTRSDQTELDINEMIRSLETSAEDPFLVVVSTQQIQVTVLDDTGVMRLDVSRDPIPLTYDLSTIQRLLAKVCEMNPNQDTFAGIQVSQLKLYPKGKLTNEKPLEYSGRR
ncbi:hypothetical protein Poli38472_003891 [Pythium oligandrum]|uniref:Uncharacterized protein n=1 Tax=Pythium oligandrum TaxID=41045 RepID=A0A8K1CM23_PYTOL|nr:hypothetical protein Poli38472_003891 [Pythium oligandrum]|eukprot:TMW66126.1 hypothetical protein Poli38472_003891 [Pythium oligandrum]